MVPNKDDSHFNCLTFLKALNEIPFPVGKNLLADFLLGDESNSSIRKNELSAYVYFGSVKSGTRDEIIDTLGSMVSSGLIEQKSLNGNSYGKVLMLTKRGISELQSPSGNMMLKSPERKNIELKITDADRQVFAAFEFLLGKYNDAQKKAIVCQSDKILCIAGAGTGKTAVLTKRIEFLAQFKSVPPDKILAITFTKKARKEMIHRLEKSPFCRGVEIETFNSFSEKLITRHNNLLYSKKIRIIEFPEKIRLLRMSLNSIKLSSQEAIEHYFSFGERRGKTQEELERIFMNDCFAVLDYCKNYGKRLEELFSMVEAQGENSLIAGIVYKVCSKIQKYMEEYGLRDYADQIVECIKLFNTFRETMPQYEHILIDEYQDINAIQEQLIEILSPRNIFSVGDPRQSIFGWRGSKISCILKFSEKYPESEIIPLNSNYRSSKKIVLMMNEIISSMNLPDLESTSDTDGEIKVIEFETEDAEFEFVLQCLLHKTDELGKIFVLGRTNRIILDLSDRLKSAGIHHVVKTEDIKRYAEDAESKVILATVHSIKGMESDTVFLVGATSSNFPCRASEHPILDMIKHNDYDKEDEEQRLFYVGVSRARKRLFISFTKNLTRFIREDMKIFPEIQRTNHALSSFGIKKQNGAESNLREWRTRIADDLGVPPYMIFTDKTLIELATYKPSCVEDLDNIYGLGPTKIRKFGEDILRVINGV